MATQNITGLASGLDTQGIIEALMSVQRQSYTRVSEKVEKEKLKLQAYQSINSMLLALKTSATTLAGSSLWNGKSASSSNENSLTASASQYANEGSYSLRVAQRATSTQYMSQGFSSGKSTVLSSSGATSGTITLESAKARVDTSAKLEDLNGGKGVFRGSVRVTDATGASGVVDLSACETVDDIVRALNGAAGVQISASLREDGEGLQITDMSGGAGTLRIQNVGQGTTATDLGIAGAVAAVDGAATLVGTDIHYLSANSLLSTLNDGQGVEEGQIYLTVKGDAGSVDVLVDLNKKETVGDVLTAVNNAIKDAAANDPAAAALLGDLSLALNDDKNGFTFTGGQAGQIYTVTNAWGHQQMANPQTANQLGLIGTFTVANDGDAFGGSALVGDLGSPLLKNLSGANQTGIGSATSLPKVPADTLDASTLLTNLNGGAGIDTTSGLQLWVYEGGGESFFPYAGIVDADRLRALATDPAATLGDLVDLVNRSFAESGVAALQNAEMKIDSAGKGVYLDGLSSAHSYQIAGSLAESLGLVHMDGGNADQGWGDRLTGGSTAADSAAVADLYAFANIGADDSMVTESTKLGELWSNGAAIDGADLDDLLRNGFTVTVGSGPDTVTATVDLSNLTADSTLDDFITTVNTALAVQFDGSGVASPYLAIEFAGMGLNWRNVDVDQDFAVAGDAADTLGFAKAYAGQSLATLGTATQKNLNPVVVGTSEAVNVDGNQLLSSLNAGQGLDFTGHELTLDIGDERVSVTRDELLAELGGSFGAATLNEYVSALNTLFTQKIADHGVLGGTAAAVTFGLSADGKGITIQSASGLNDGDGIALGGDMARAASTGLRSMGSVSGADFESPEAADIRGVTSTAAAVGGLGYIVLEAGGRTVTLNTDGLDQNSTLNDLLNTLNSQLAANGLADMSFSVSDSGSGIAFTNDSNSTVTFKYDDVSSLASDLGLVGTAADPSDRVVSANSHTNASSLNRHYVSRSTTLASLNNGQGADQGVLSVTNAQGTTVTIDLSEALTVGDVIDAINGLVTGVRATINAAGDGILIQATDGTGTGNIVVSNHDGSKTAEHLGLAGVGTGGADGLSVLNGSMKTVIEVGANDTLADLRDRIAAANSNYKTSLVDDGTGSNGIRLSISSASTGAGYDFIIDTDIAALGLTQMSKAKDSLVLYGNPDSGASPIVLKSSTNTNSQAITGLTLNLNAVSDTYTTITVAADTEGVVEEIQNLVQCYNDLSDLITYLDSYNRSTEEKSILFGDSTIRTLMDQIDEMFYQINTTSSGATWSWMDLGISFSNNNSNTDGESGYWYSRMELNLDTLNDAVAKNWDVMKESLFSQRNASNSKAGSGTTAAATFNFQYDRDENGNIIYPEGSDDPNNAINNDKTSSNFGVSNGFTANKTIAEGENQYTIYFSQPTTLDRISIYHPDSEEYPASEYALRDFTIEYLNTTTGQWEVYREVTNNTGASTILGVAVTAGGIRITAKSTNAEDGKFRLLDVQCQESTGLANQLSKTVNSLTDVVDGYFTTANENVENNITALQEQMTKLDERLNKKEEALWRKFNAMESILSEMQSQGDYLSTLFSSMSSNSSK